MRGKKGGRPEALTTDPDATETSTQNVSKVSVPSFERNESDQTTRLSQPDTTTYQELVNSPWNVVEVRLARTARDLDGIRGSMLELLQAGRGPECTRPWSRLATELQVVLLDLDHLSADISLLARQRRTP